jgi:hypothetical protein
MTLLTEYLADNPLNYWRLADPHFGRAASIGSQHVDLAAFNSSVQEFGYSGVASDGGSVLLSGLGLRNTAVQFPVPGSIEWWMWCAFGQDTFMPVLNLAASGGALSVRLNATNMDFNITGGTTGTATRPSDQAWHQFVYRCGGGTQDLWIDGSSAGSSSAGAAAGATGLAVLGQTTSGVGSALFVAEAAIFNSVLSSTRIGVHLAAADTASIRPSWKEPWSDIRAAVLKTFENAA